MKKFLTLLLLLSICLMPNFNVQAEEVRIKYNKLQGIAYNRKLDGKFKTNTATMFQMGDRIAYCIEPGVEILDNYYDIYTDWDIVDFSDDLKEYIEKIGYYGYDYPGHQTNYYYIAAQELIWKAVRPEIEVVWTTGENYSGEVIDISKEKTEILDLVKNHDLKPSFSEKEFKGEVGSMITLEDENNVLDEYDLSESKYHEVTLEGNKLMITLNNELVPSERLTLKRKHYDKAPLLIYSNGNSQKLSALRITYDKDNFVDIKNEEVPEIVSVPNTGTYNFTGLFGTLLVGVGLVLAKFY